MAAYSGKLRADGFQLCLLLVARDGDVTSLVDGDALLQRGIVEITAAPEDFLQRSLLG